MVFAPADPVVASVAVFAAVEEEDLGPGPVLVLVVAVQTAVVETAVGILSLSAVPLPLLQPFLQYGLQSNFLEPNFLSWVRKFRLKLRGFSQPRYRNCLCTSVGLVQMWQDVWYC